MNLCLCLLNVPPTFLQIPVLFIKFLNRKNILFFINRDLVTSIFVLTFFSSPILKLQKVSECLKLIAYNFEALGFESTQNRMYIKFEVSTVESFKVESSSYLDALNFGSIRI